MFKLIICEIMTKTKQVPKKNKYAFTLIEVLLGVALLLIIVFIVSQGLIATMQYSANTAQYQKSGNAAKSEANSVLSGIGSSVSGQANILLTNIDTGATITPIKVDIHTLAPVPDTGYSTFEDTMGATDNRHVFTYVPAP